MQTQATSPAESARTAGPQAADRSTSDQIPSLDEARATAELLKAWETKRVTRPAAKRPNFRTIMDRVNHLPARTDHELAEDAKRFEESEQRRKQREHDERAEKLIAACGVPLPRYGKASFDQMDIPRQHLSPDEFRRYEFTAAHVRDLIETPGTLVLRGENGPGKTFLASAMVLEACRRLKRARYAMAFDFLLDVRSTFGTKGRTELDVFNRWVAYEILVVDEFEVRNGSEWENMMLRNLFTKRDAMSLKTLIITNKSLSELETYLGKPLVDRLRHDIGGVIDCDWQSLRRCGQMKIAEADVA